MNQKVRLVKEELRFFDVMGYFCGKTAGETDYLSRNSQLELNIAISIIILIFDQTFQS